MSIMKCETCECMIDTDAHPETFRTYETDGATDACICESCWERDQRNPETQPVAEKEILTRVNALYKKAMEGMASAMFASDWTATRWEDAKPEQRTYYRDLAAHAANAYEENLDTPDPMIDFLNLLKVMQFIDLPDLEGAFGGEIEWEEFRDNPWKWMVHARRDKAAIVWAAMMKDLGEDPVNAAE